LRSKSSRKQIPKLNPARQMILKLSSRQKAPQQKKIKMKRKR
jgi:hypothetical protein